MAKILIAMSGGVDSSVAAALLKQQGHEVIGATMEIWSGDAPQVEGRKHGCYGPEEKNDTEDARRVAESLGIPFHVFDLREAYRSIVLDHFQREYLAGRTPNPCIRCNRHIKFDALLRKARDSGIDYDFIATGHYARTEHDEINHRALLKKARDTQKDQSYFLFYLLPEQLGRLLFPLGDYTKTEVRAMAANLNLGVKDKAESQNFISGGYHPLVAAQAQAGPIMDSRGNILGQHRGIPFYTIGQRRNLGIATGKPMYVTAIDCRRNAVIVGDEDELYHDELTAADLNLIGIGNLERPLEVQAKIRYTHPGAAAVVTSLDERRVHLKFREPQASITPGQAVVFYAGDYVLGGGIIESAG